MASSDFQINSKIRAILAKHWVDTPKLRFGSFRGTVRMSGSLHFLGARVDANTGSAKIETLAREVRAVRGAVRVYFDFDNWRRGSTGGWESTETTNAAVVDNSETVTTLNVEDKRETFAAQSPSVEAPRPRDAAGASNP